MSYHFEHGFRFSTENLLEIHAYMMDLRREVAPLVVAKTAAWLARQAAAYVDRWRVLGRSQEDRGVAAISKAWWAMIDRQARIRQDRARAPEVDFSLEIAIIPIGERILGLYYTEQADFVELIRSKAWFIDHSFQTSTDPDEAVSPEDWAGRREDWLNMIERNPVPAMNGLSAMIADREITQFPDRRAILRSLPSFEKRVRDIVRSQLFDRFAERMPESVAAHNIVNYLREFDHWSQSRSGRRKWRQTTAEVEQRLTQKLTWRHLAGWPKKKCKEVPKP
jgi:hypothetical protein